MNNVAIGSSTAPLLSAHSIAWGQGWTRDPVTLYKIKPGDKFLVVCGEEEFDVLESFRELKELRERLARLEKVVDLMPGCGPGYLATVAEFEQAAASQTHCFIPPGTGVTSNGPAGD